MSYPYEDDLMFGSEAATCNQIQRVIIEGGSEPGPEPVQAVYWLNQTSFKVLLNGSELQVKYKIDADNSDTALMDVMDNTRDPLNFSLSYNSRDGKAFITLASKGEGGNPQVFGTAEPASIPLTQSVMLKQSSGAGGGGVIEIGTITLTLVQDVDGVITPVESAVTASGEIKVEEDYLVRVPPLS